MDTYTIHYPVHSSWHGLSIQDLFKIEWQLPKKLVHQLRMEKAVTINGALKPWSQPLYEGDVVSIMLSLEPYPHVNVSTSITLEVLFEDEHLIIVNKPAGLITHPNNGETDTLLHAVRIYLCEKGAPTWAQHIHRLDQDTSGAIIFAKNPISYAILDRLLFERKIKRKYIGIADGIISRKQFMINEPIGRDRHHPSKRRVSKTGQPAITHVTVLEVFFKRKLTLIECQLETGRTHQIRVHLSSLGHPLAGDKLYGGASLFNRQALHARSLAFIHPFTIEPVKINAPFNDDPPIFHMFNNSTMNK